MMSDTGSVAVPGDDRRGDGEHWRGEPGPAHARRGGVGQTLKRTLTEFREDELTDRAAALTYYSVLSIFPALIAMVSLVGLVGDPQTITDTLTGIAESLGSASAVETFEQPIDDVTSNRGAAGFGLIIGLVSALWTASGYIGAFMRASNEIYEVEEGRSVFTLRPLQMVVTLILVVLLALVLGAIALTGPVAREVGDQIGVGGGAVTAWNILKWPVLGLVVMFMLALLYYSAPNAKLPGFRWITPGSVVAVLVWIAASVAFALFVANFGSYNTTYGALAGVVVALIWLWLTNLAILFGAELNAEVERSRELDEGTAGAERKIQLPERRTPKPKKRARTV